MKVIRGLERAAFMKNVNRLRHIKGLGTAYSLFSTGYSTLQISNNQNWENGINLGVGIGSFFAWEVGAVYGTG